VSLSLAELGRVVEEVRPQVEGGRLENAYPAGRDAVVLVFYAKRRKVLLLVSARPGFSRLHLLSRRPEGAGDLPHFVTTLRKSLRGCTLRGMALVGGDRVVELHFARRGEPAGSLIAELTGRTCNLYYLDATGSLVAALRRPGRGERDLRPGALYHRPAPAASSPAAARDRFIGEVSYSEAIERHYGEAEAREEMAALRRAISSSLKARRKRLGRLIDKLRSDLASAEEAEDLKLKGELLKAHLGAVPPRQENITVENLFDEARAEVEIALDPRLSPQQNMERYFRRYKKLRVARERAQARLAQALEDLDQLDRALHDLEAADTVGELEAIAQRVGRRPGTQAPQPRAGPLRFTSADGHEILVARSARENDELTFRIARGSDLWLHVEGYRGSHVVVRLPKGKSCPKETLLDAATLAIRYSELRRAGGGPVVYCARKDVSRPRGAQPGNVLYTRSKTLHVRVEEERVRRLMGKGGP